jgi:O-acetyl-ADP-ribose deacetylase (regulator of RNase III)
LTYHKACAILVVLMKKEIEIIGGNLLDFPTHCESDPDKHVGINVIAHSCNCQNVMGAGIAKQIKDRYPKAFEADTERWGNEYNDGGNWRCQIGDYSKWTNFDSNVYHATIYNLYTQSGYSTKKREVNYEYFWKAMKAMQEDLLFIQHETGTPRVLGLPYGISCGLAGGNWKIIKAIIEDIFLDSLIECYIVKYDDLGKDSPSDWQRSSFERTQ